MKKITLIVTLWILNINFFTVASFNPEATEKMEQAMKEDDVSKILQAIGEHADFNVTDPYGCTPLIWAVRNNHFNLVSELLKRGVSVHSTDFLGYTPLMYAKTVNMVLFLLDNGADLNAVNKGGHTALTIAVVANKFRMVKALLDKGARLDIVGKDGTTALTNSPTLAMDEILQNYAAKAMYKDQGKK
ncbi:ankyrin repeat domain-containing protein [Candidatus Babeliales bacterium]|nr:ankyrin repeat domain-containing protein [Candidatus Babeliales bacterium]